MRVSISVKKNTKEEIRANRIFFVNLSRWLSRICSLKLQMIRNFALILFLSTGVHSLETSLLEQHHNVQYKTYTKENRNQPLDIRDVTVNDGQTTSFIIHGYSPSSLDQPMKLVNDIFDHDRNVSRVIVVSWIDYASGKKE